MSAPRWTALRDDSRHDDPRIGIEHNGPPREPLSGDPPQIVHKTTTVAAGLPGLDCGQYDMMAVGLVASDERKKSVAFTEPIFWGQNVIVVPPGSTHVGKIFEEHPGVLKVALTSAQDRPGAEAIDKNLTKSPTPTTRS
ncbi:transporter substrate-binding domain-containing protein [Amycolatopsis acidiphila]|uniref:Amino acid ABC transporter substrate-binding protein n=1 Tax=Amycolatopsis acidiphila TaxID=715473 RepID=A0A558ALY7_9PSEU|nr:transporter substrate-binding domain-containing protein [Amycolatopsis acidiphila]TVT25282.1 amino acid ABC transporter substrate-binding protein [Amycolatopsis acidiphila]UIJ62404.1 transporter substrate-binding domain-containing protein [Amycolatopsis acidiphila]GHG83505.1 hypothetical protein GCM10017788_54660 [Amycolatopsis acidiphila]